MVHKILVLFSAGMSLTNALKNNPYIAIGLISMLALFSPLFGVIGILIEVIFKFLTNK